MWQADGEKDCVLTRGGLTGRWKPVVTTNCEKSAEVIVGKAEGPNNVTVQSNVCPMEYPTAGKRNVNEQVLHHVKRIRGNGKEKAHKAPRFEVMLNRRMPNGMYGGVRGERKSPLLDCLPYS